jgi:hypothetical protein
MRKNMGKCRTKLDGSRPSFLSQNSLRILILEARVSQNVLFRYKPQHAVPGWNLAGIKCTNNCTAIGLQRFVNCCKQANKK